MHDAGLIPRFRQLTSLLLLTLAAARPAASETAIAALQAANQRIFAELAVSDAERRRGLMHREALPANHGMLFVYSQPGYYCMWMKDTFIPLSVGFLDEAGEIINIARMQPRSLERHCALKPASFALEMEGAWFDRHGLAPGMTIEGLERLPAAH